MIKNILDRAKSRGLKLFEKMKPKDLLQTVEGQEVKKSVEEFQGLINDFWSWQFRQNPNLLLKGKVFKKPSVYLFSDKTNSPTDEREVVNSSAIPKFNEVFINIDEIKEIWEFVKNHGHPNVSIRAITAKILAHEYGHIIQGQIYEKFPNGKTAEDQADYFTGTLISYFERAKKLTREETSQIEISFLTIGSLGQYSPGSFESGDTNWQTCTRSTKGHATGQVRANRYNQGYMTNSPYDWPKDFVHKNVNFGLDLNHFK
jgi:predicted metalloprotease